MPGMPYENDDPALCNVALPLRMDLGHQRARRVENLEIARVRLVFHRLRHAVGTEDRHRPGRHFRKVLDEARALGAQPFDNMPVVYDLVANVHRRAELLERALDNVDRTYDARAKAAGLRKDHLHATSLCERPHRRAPCATIERISSMIRRMMPCCAAPNKPPVNLRALGKRATLLAAIVALLPGAASGHAIVLTASPAANAHLSPGNIEIRLQFNSRIDSARSRLALQGPDGIDHPVAVTRSEPPGVLAGHATITTTGPWKLRWQVLSMDGHITRGEIAYFVDEHKMAP
jgi:methionine-rich copper-binding protein CopC